MITFIRDKIATARLKARYQRLIQESVLDLIEESGPQPVSEDPGNWMLVGDAKSQTGETKRTDARTKARNLVVNNPHARNLLRLLESYVTGGGLNLHHIATGSNPQQDELTHIAARLWSQFLSENQRHFSYREYARRTWRDGECFLRKFSDASWPPVVGVIDKENIAATVEHPESQGILTDPLDVETPLMYLQVNSSNGRLQEEIPADVLFHAKIGVDSNQKRGLTIFSPILDSLSCFDKWLDTELVARKLQASIVLWRKVQGSPSQASAVADAAKFGNTLDPTGSVRRERFRAGTILTTSQGTDLQFLQPNTNFEDSAPLGRMLLLCVAAGAGLPEFMITSDASNANFASTMVAEGPAVKFFQSEQEFFSLEFTRIWKSVMSDAIGLRLLPEDFFEQVQVNWSFPQLVSRDRPKERSADARLVAAGVLSRAEVARRDGVDPATMRQEIDKETNA